MSIPDARAAHPYGDTPSPKRFGTVSPLDPAMFSRIDDHAEELLKGTPSARYSPPEVAGWLEELAAAATAQLATAEVRSAHGNSPELRRLSVDVTIQCGLGLFFAHKLRAGVLYALYDRSRNRQALEESLKAYRAARGAWAELSRQAQGVYRPDITFGLDRHLRGHWQDRLPAIDQDIERLAALLEKTAGQAPAAQDEEQVRKAVRGVREPSPRPRLAFRHQPPPAFRRGDTVPIALTVARGEETSRPVAITLHYRPVHQAEAYRSEPMKLDADRWLAVVPAAATQSPYPLQYFFELRDAAGRAWLYPGFEANLCNQPYFVVRQA
jgi:hypothetical protein